MRDIKPHMHGTEVFTEKYLRLNNFWKESSLPFRLQLNAIPIDQLLLRREDCKEFKIERGEGKVCGQMLTTPRRSDT
jgi:hypothetical protein